MRERGREMHAAQRGPCSRRFFYGAAVMYMQSRAVVHKDAGPLICRVQSVHRVAISPRLAISGTLPLVCFLASVSLLQPRRATHCCTRIDARLSSRIRRSDESLLSFWRNIAIPSIEISEKTPSKRKMEFFFLEAECIVTRLLTGAEGTVTRCELICE